MTRAWPKSWWAANVTYESPSWPHFKHFSIARTAQPKMLVTIKALTGGNFQVDVQPTDTVSQIGQLPPLSPSAKTLTLTFPLPSAFF